MGTGLEAESHTERWTTAVEQIFTEMVSAVIMVWQFREGGVMTNEQEVTVSAGIQTPAELS
jgi:hypothetical protein